MAMMGVMTVSAQQKVENKDAQVAINNIMTRTSIRQYTNEPVSKADIETMLRAGMAAPTAVNKQPWRIIVRDGKYHFYEKKDKGYVSEATGDLQKIDVGIALCHFDLSLEEDGISGSFVFEDPELAVPGNTYYIVSWKRAE